MQKLISLLRQYGRKYKEMILYVFFGGLTTLLNMAVYWVLYTRSGVANVPATLAAWVAGVIFAFVTNKLWVFESRSLSLAVLGREALSFLGCRAATGILDVGIMYLTVDIFAWNGTLMKLLSNIIVILLNFIASKLWIFKKK